MFLIPWTREWEAEFFLGKEKIVQKLVRMIKAVHHIGNTAVEHLSAKPVIDIDDTFNNRKVCIEPLEELSYVYNGTEIVPDLLKKSREPISFICTKAGIRIFLKICSSGIICGRMRNSGKSTNICKKQLAAKVEGDKYTYNEGKTTFIHAALPGRAK